MEAETYFLFVFWTLNEELRRLEGNIEYRGSNIVMKRTSMQRPIRPNELYKRIPVDFDPLGKHLVYVVSCFFQQEHHPTLILTDIIVPTYIAESETEAQEVKKRLEEGEYKEFAGRKQKLQKVEIHPLVVTVQ